MLHSTFTKRGEVAAHGHGGHAAEHGHGHGHGAHAIKIIERSAPYTHTSSLSWYHFHLEPNFRKEPLHYGAYKTMDVFAPFHSTFPIRNVEKAFAPGLWFGWAHVHASKWGKWNWKLGRKVFPTMQGAWIVSVALYWLRFHKTGWETKNKGAVSGM